MLLGEMLRNNYDIDRIDVTTKTLDLFMRLDYLHAESDLEKLIDDAGSSDMGSLLSEIEARIVEHLIYIAHEYGITLNEDHNVSLYELYILIDGLERLTTYEMPDEILDLVDSREDDVECLVELLSLVVKEMDSGNVYDFYNVVVDASDEFWKNLLLTVTGEREEIVDLDGTNQDIKVPLDQGLVWEWISMSGRTGYNLRAAFTLLADSIDEGLTESPKTLTVPAALLELKTLVHYSSSEDKSDELILKLLEELVQSPDILSEASIKLPYIELRFED